MLKQELLYPRDVESRFIFLVIWHDLVWTGSVLQPFCTPGRKPILDSSCVCNYKFHMGDISWKIGDFVFVCNAEKRQDGLKKHGLDFIDASTAFLDPYAISFYDTKHSDDEDRHILIGQALNTVLVFVVHTERDGVFRIISARKAVKNEVKIYARQR